MGRPFVITSQTITRPANITAYASGDLVANNVTAGSVTPFLFSNVVHPNSKGIVRRALLFANQNLLTNGTFRLHLFTLAPTVTNGDNAAFSPATNLASYLGYIEIVLIGAGAEGANGWAWTPAPTLGIPFQSVSGNLWGLLEARAAYVPSSGETFYCQLEVEN